MIQLRRAWEVISLALFAVALTAIWYAPFAKGYLMGDDLGQAQFFDARGLWSTLHAALLEAPSDRYRPVYSLAAALQNAIFGGDYTLYWVTNVVLIGVNAAFVGVICAVLARSRTTGVIFTVGACLAQYTWYHALQALGLLESLSITLLLVAVAASLQALRSGSRRWAAAAITAIIALSLTHERFSAISVAVSAALFVALRNHRRAVRLRWAAAPVTAVAAIALWKAWVIGVGTSSAGAGGGELSFGLQQAAETLKLGGLGVMGFNIGPAHLAVIDSRASGVVGALPLILFVTGGAVALCAAVWFSIRQDSQRLVSGLILGGLLIATSALSIAVATRLEWRWLYAPFLCSLIVTAWLVGQIPTTHRWRLVPAVCLGASALLAAVAVRESVSNLYLFQGQRAVRALASQLENEPASVRARTTYVINSTPYLVFADWYLLGGYFCRLYCPDEVDLRIERSNPTRVKTSRPRLEILEVTPDSIFPSFAGPTRIGQALLAARQRTG